MTPRTVYVLTIHSRRDDYTSLHASEEGARDALVAYVDQAVDFTYDDLPPDQAIARYFKESGEDYTLDQQEVYP